MDIAKTLSLSVFCDEICEVTVAGGYLNFKIDATAFAKRILSAVEAEGEKYGAHAVAEEITVVTAVRMSGSFRFILREYPF